jgi:gamma-glutamyltranspeptidase/glutathione hydrolase
MLRVFSRGLSLPLLAGGTSLAALLLGVPAGAAREDSLAHGVATENATATREAIKLLDAGGNAIDAAIAAALVAGATSPASSGLGGGGFAIVWSARDKLAFTLDFRESAPAAIDVEAFETRPFTEAERGRAVGTPGELAGLFELHQRFGRLPWARIVQRAAQIADGGFEVEPHLAGLLKAQAGTVLSRQPAFVSAYLARGAPGAGQRVRAPKLAATLRNVARLGKRGFYEGWVAQDIVSAARAAGGALASTDLRDYTSKVREPLRVSWDGKEVLTMPPPSAGGLLLVQTLSLFSRAELVALAPSEGARLHLLAEAMRGSFADRMRYFGDPDFAPVDLAKLLDPRRLARRKARLAAERTHTQPRFGLEEAGTHHLVTADNEGNWVTLTTTINAPFGAKIVGERSGVILNNELEDFTSKKDVAVFGVSESPNRPRARARPVSSMTPTLVLEAGSPTLALGGSGGITIAAAVTQVLLTRLASGASLTDAVAAPRFVIPPPRSGKTLMLEPELMKRLGRDLEQRGELLQERELKGTGVQAVARTPSGFEAAADPRKGGHAETR